MFYGQAITHWICQVQKRVWSCRAKVVNECSEGVESEPLALDADWKRPSQCWLFLTAATVRLSFLPDPFPEDIPRECSWDCCIKQFKQEKVSLYILSLAVPPIALHFSLCSCIPESALSISVRLHFWLCLPSRCYPISACNPLSLIELLHQWPCPLTFFFWILTALHFFPYLAIKPSPTSLFYPLIYDNASPSLTNYIFSNQAPHVSQCPQISYHILRYLIVPLHCLPFVTVSPISLLDPASPTVSPVFLSVLPVLLASPSMPLALSLPTVTKVTVLILINSLG